MKPQTKLTHQYYFFVKDNEEYRLELPKTLEEYIQIESKIPPGTLCVQAFKGYYLGARTKVSITLWRNYLLPLPPEIKTFLTILNIDISE